LCFVFFLPLHFVLLVAAERRRAREAGGLSGNPPGYGALGQGGNGCYGGGGRSLLFPRAVKGDGGDKDASNEQ